MEQEKLQKIVEILGIPQNESLQKVRELEALIIGDFLNEVSNQVSEEDLTNLSQHEVVDKISETLGKEHASKMLEESVEKIIGEYIQLFNDDLNSEKREEIIKLIQT